MCIFSLFGLVPEHVFQFAPRTWKLALVCFLSFEEDAHSISSHSYLALCSIFDQIVGTLQVARITCEKAEIALKKFPSLNQSQQQLTVENEEGFQSLALVVHVQVVSQSDFKHFFQVFLARVDGSTKHWVHLEMLGDFGAGLQKLVSHELVLV